MFLFPRAFGLNGFNPAPFIALAVLAALRLVFLRREMRANADKDEEEPISLKDLTPPLRAPSAGPLGDMVKIEATIRHERLAQVEAALQEYAISNLTLTEVQAVNYQRPKTRVYRGNQYLDAHEDRVKLEMLAPEADAPAITARIRETAKTGDLGDGSIIVSSLSRAISIRTGETGGLPVE